MTAQKRQMHFRPLLKFKTMLISSAQPERCMIPGSQCAQIGLVKAGMLTLHLFSFSMEASIEVGSYTNRCCWNSGESTAKKQEHTGSISVAEHESLAETYLQSQFSFFSWNYSICQIWGDTSAERSCPRKMFNPIRNMVRKMQKGSESDLKHLQKR